MAQAAIAPLNPATTSGTDLADILTDYEEAANTSHSGTSRPSYVQPGMAWLDTTTTPWVMKFYDGANDVPLYQVSATSSRLRSRAAESTIASAATTDVLGAATDFVAVSGTATITSLGSEPLQIKYVRATGAFVLTHNATTLILPTSANITAASGDTFIVISDTSGNARVMGYQRASGSALSVPAAEVPAGTVMLFFQTSAPTGWTKDTTNFNDHAIRIVTGTPSSGGSLNFSTVFAKTATNSHTLTENEMPAHDHASGSLAGVTSSGGSHDHDFNYRKVSGRSKPSAGTEAGNWPNDWEDTDDESGDTESAGTHSHTVDVNEGTTSDAGGGSGHTHTMDIRVRYVDAIRATKN